MDTNQALNLAAEAVRRHTAKTMGVSWLSNELLRKARDLLANGKHVAVLTHIPFAPQLVGEADGLVVVGMPENIPLGTECVIVEKGYLNAHPDLDIQAAVMDRDPEHIIYGV
jgi:hypothetical protein